MQNEPGRVIEARNAMGTRFEIVLPGSDLVGLRGAAEAALDEIQRLEAQLTKFDARSEVSGINAYAAERPVRVEPRLFQLIQTAMVVCHATDGAFDPTVGPLMRAWGFVGGSGRMPDPEEVARAREVTGYALVGLDPEDSTIWFAQAGVSLDLGAIGKGYGIDRALEVLEDAGIEAALIHGGTSTVFGMGAPQGETGWRVALRDPSAAEGVSLGTVTLRDRALSVSGSHGRSFREGDRLYGHVLDPRTGEPTQGALLSAVSHPSATLTDALSTALLVLGSEGLSGLAEQFPDADLLVVTVEGDAPVIHLAGPGAWQFRVHPAAPATPTEASPAVGGDV